MNVTGQIYKIGTPQQVTDKFLKQDVIIKTEGQYPEHIKVDFVQDKTVLLNGYVNGDNVVIEFNLKGNLSKDGQTAYVNLQGWAIKKV